MYLLYAGEPGRHQGGLFCADSGFHDGAVVALLKAKKISPIIIINARLTQALHKAIVDQCKWARSGGWLGGV